MSALCRAIWHTALNRPVDGDQFDRRTMWALTRPYWTHVALTTEEPCGCRRRFGLWRTIWCFEHVFGPDGADEIAAICGVRPNDVPAAWAVEDAKAALRAVAPAIVARAKAEALREAADALDADQAKKNPPLGQIPGSVLCGPAYLLYRAAEIERAS
jgi:hypothetical protein